MHCRHVSSDPTNTQHLKHVPNVFIFMFNKGLANPVESSWSMFRANLAEIKRCNALNSVISWNLIFVNFLIEIRNSIVSRFPALLKSLRQAKLHGELSSSHSQQIDNWNVHCHAILMTTNWKCSFSRHVSLLSAAEAIFPFYKFFNCKFD